MTKDEKRVVFTLKDALWKYNNFRPHFNLHGSTPMEYISNIQEAA